MRVLTPAQREARRAYRRAYHLKHRERVNQQNRARYHSVYKHDAETMERRRASYRRYAKLKGPAWVRERSKRYAKRYRDLSDKQKQLIREACREWTKTNWSRRVEYARQYRRRHPLFGFKTAIRRAVDTGDFGALSALCLKAIVSADGGRR